MLKKVLVFLLGFGSALLVMSCAEGTRSTWKAKGADFKKYKTYAWVAPGDTILTMKRDDKLFAGTIYLHANEELKKKGMTLVNRRPDAVFMFDTQVEDRTRYNQSATLSVGVGYGGPGYYVGGSMPVAGGKITAVPYQEGRLIIEMFDVDSKELVWRGWVQKTVDYSSNIDQVLRWAIRDIMYYLPVKNKS